jgi:hypothetical protein
MFSRRASGFAAGAIVVACSLPAARGDMARRLPGADPEHSRLRFADSLTSLNDRCMVRQVKLNPKVRPVYVNRLPVGFC